jgi:hypothetical protein
MAFIPPSTRIYYEFAINYYDNEQCSIFNNSTSEKDYCNKHDYRTINECCNYIASQKNVILNVCNDSIKYTCGYDEEVRTQARNDLYNGFGIFGIGVLVILFILFCANCNYQINKKYSKNEYIPLNT